MGWFTFSIVLLCLLISAFFSASETALTGASRASMLRLSKQGNSEATVVSSLMAMRERMIGALLLGNNIANIGASALATGIFTAWFGDVGVLYATGVMTVLVVIFAEVSAARLIAVKGVDAHELTELEEVGDAAGLLEALVEGVGLAEDPDTRLALAGDWNIAPQDEDVWDIELFQREGYTHVSPAERAAFHAFEDAGLVDVVRPRHPGPGVYTYWDYTGLAFPKKKGMRIDFQLCSPALARTVTDAWIDREERKGKGASDHAPVVVELG